jgi:hypothetical protein
MVAYYEYNEYNLNYLPFGEPEAEKMDTNFSESSSFWPSYSPPRIPFLSITGAGACYDGLV